MSEATRQIVIKDERHAHTASMRLLNAADLVMQEDDLSPEDRLIIRAELQRIAAQIRAAAQKGSSTF